MQAEHTAVAFHLGQARRQIAVRCRRACRCCRHDCRSHADDRLPAAEGASRHFAFSFAEGFGCAMRARCSDSSTKRRRTAAARLMHVALGLVDMLDHELAHLLRIAAPRRRQQPPVRRDIGLAKLVALRMVRIAHRHRVAQQVVDDLAHEAQQQVGIGRGQHVVEVQVLLPLRQRLLGAGGMRRAGLDAALQRREVLLGEMRHGAGRQLGLEQAAHGVDLRHVELAKEEIVLQKLQGAVQRHLADGGAARRAGASPSPGPALPATSAPRARCPC